MVKKHKNTTSEIFAQQINVIPKSERHTPIKLDVLEVPENPLVIEGLQNKIFLDRYAWKDEKGEPMESVPNQMWKRVAKAIANVEKTPKLQKEWEDRFYYALSDFKFLPGGRILSAAGTGYEVTYYNCFVIPSPPDSRGGIIDNLKVMTEMLSRAGGVGINLSTLRPSGARVHKVNGTSSGPVNWANLYSVACHDVIQQGGSRRGALMLMLHDWHPDIEEFIEAKTDHTKLTGANLSVCLSDSFMEAVENDADWVLRFPDHKHPQYDLEWDGDLVGWIEKGYPVVDYKTVKAKDIWNKICQLAWASAEPGLHFLERSNKQSNTWYFEKLVCTNPCVTGDTWVHTSKGPRQVYDLIGKPFLARVNGNDHLSGWEGFFKTGNKKVVNLQTVEGYNLHLTSNHLVKKIIDTQSHQAEWSEAGSLDVGDYIEINNHRTNSQWSGKYNYKEGYLIGLLVGDGTLKTDKAVLSVWDTPKLSVVAKPNGAQSMMQFAFQCANSVPHRSDFSGWMFLPDRNEYRMSLGYVKRLAYDLGMYPGRKTITKEIEKASSDFYKGFLRGLFDSDGSVQGYEGGRTSIRLAQSDLSLLQAVQRMLLRLGIFSHIYKNRRKAGKKLLPNGKNGYKEYPVKAQHELSITMDNIGIFNELIGFVNSEKSAKLTQKIAAHSDRGFYMQNFVARIESIEFEANENVYDVKIPGINHFDANGITAHNCGEQPLGPWAVCNLGSLNLSAFVENGEMDYKKLAEHAAIAVRFLDNVIDDNYYFYPENENVQKNIRRVGLGTMGLGDALIKMKIRYGSPESLEIIEKIYKTVRDSAYQASSDIALEKGSFPKFNKEKYLQGYFIKQLPDSIRESIAKQGIRNAVLLTQAPTGTTSLLAGVSSGIEPVYDFAMKRVDRTGESIIYHPLFKEWKDKNEGAEIPNYFAGANDLTPDDHILVQATVQKYTDASISKTVNAQNNHTIEDVQKLYMDAYKLGCKGITYMRDGSREGVLSHIETSPKEEQITQQQVVHRPMILPGHTYEILTPVGKAFITINQDDRGIPMEVFITVGKTGMHTGADAEALGRLISIALRVDPGKRLEVAEKIVNQLRGIGGASHIGFGKERVMSLADAVAKVMAEDLSHKAPVDEVETMPLDLDSDENISTTNGIDHSQMSGLPFEEQNLSKSGDLCPECGQATFVFEEGCKKCHNCGHSMC